MKNTQKVLRATSTIVREILEVNPLARDSDDILYYNVCKRLGAMDSNTTISDWLYLRHRAVVPPFETVSRCRRKVQEKYPELSASADTEGYRFVEEEIYREWARTENEF